MADADVTRRSGPAPARTTVVAVCVAVAVVGLNTTAVGVATRGMADELDLPLGTLSWVMSAYLVTAAAFSLVGGRMGDVVGRARTFLTGLGLLAAGTVLAAVATGELALITGRAIQGLGAALVMPASIELIVAFSPPSGPSAGFRARGIIYASAFGVGPLVGGLLTDHVSWRALFWLEAAVVLVAAALALPLRHRASDVPEPATRDFRGAALVVAVVFLVMFAADRSRVWGWLSWPMLLVGAALALLGLALVRIESRVEHPLLHRSLLRDRNVLGANAATLAASIGMLGLVYFFNVFAQSAAVFDSTALGVAAALVPFTVAIVVFAHLSAFLSHRLGYRGPVTVGLSLSIAGFFWLSKVTVGTTEAEVAIPLALCGIGAGIANAGLTSPAVLSSELGRVDEAAGLTSLTRFFGSAIAIAIGTATYLSVAVGARTAELRPGGDDLERVVTGGEHYTAVAHSLRSDLRRPFEAATNANSVEAFAGTMRLTAVVLAVLTALAMRLLASAGRGAHHRAP